MLARPPGSAVLVDVFVVLAVAVSGRISSVPVAPFAPNHDCRTSSRAMVRPGSMSTVVCFPCVMPPSPVGVNVTWYFIGWAEEFVTRMSDWNLELMPSACATAGMMSASGGGPLLAVGATGCTRLTETVVDDEGLVSSGLRLEAPDAEPNVTVTAPLLVPTGSPSVFAVTVSVVPSGGTVPLDGATLSHGWLVDAVNVSPAVAAIHPRGNALPFVPPPMWI